MSTVPELFYRLLRNAIAIFTGRNLLWHISAVALTMAIVTTGGDWAYYRWTRAEAFFALARPALRLGMLMPILGPLVILLAGEVTKNRRLISTAWAMGQAALLAYLTTSCYRGHNRASSAAVSRVFWSACTDRLQPRFPIRISQRRHFLGLAIGAHDGGVFHGALPDHALSQKQNPCFGGFALRVLYWARSFSHDPLGFRIRRLAPSSAP